MTRRLTPWTAVVLAAALAPAASAIGVYGAGGLAAYGDLETRYPYGPFVAKSYEDLGASYWLGGGFVLPVWQMAGAVRPSLEVATDVGFSAKKKDLETTVYAGDELAWKLVGMRENLVFGLEFAAAPVKPFVGFGAGVAIVPWSLTALEGSLELDSGTEVQPAFAIPFGCEFRLDPNFAVSARAEKLFITGDIKPLITTAGVKTALPDLFLLIGVARVDF